MPNEATSPARTVEKSKSFRGGGVLDLPPDHIPVAAFDRITVAARANRDLGLPRREIDEEASEDELRE